MKLSWSSIGKKLIDAVSTGCDIYLFSKLLFFPFLFSLGLPLADQLFADTALLLGGITSLCLFASGIMDAEKKTKLFAQELQHHQAIIERNEELFSKLSAQLSMPLQRRDTQLIVKRHDLGSWIRSGLNQAVNTWAISSAILIPWLGLTPVAPISLIISSMLAVGVGLYFSSLKAKDMKLEQTLELENQTALSDYLAALGLKSKALNVTCASYGRFKRAVLQVMQRRRDYDRGLNEVVKILKEYDLANYWNHTKTLTTAFIFGGITGSSVASILTTFAGIAFAVSPPAWAASSFLAFGALWMGYNNYQVQNDKLERERNKALTNRYREKTQAILQEIEQSLSPADESPVKLVSLLGIQSRMGSVKPDVDEVNYSKLRKECPMEEQDSKPAYLRTCSL